MESTWAWREVPIMEAVIELHESRQMGGCSAGEVVERTGLSLEDVRRGVIALNGTYLDVHRSAGDPSTWSISKIHPTARQAARQWPTAENMVDQLIVALDRVEAETTDQGERSRLATARRSLTEVGRALLVEVAAKAFERSVGL
ncbi:MAG: hypothetical protein ACYCWW_15945 [Deltaproteobacteria bacterium]